MNRLCARAVALKLTGLAEITINELADYLARDNERFDRERFLIACGVQTESDSNTIVFKSNPDDDGDAYMYRVK
jgi:hypothetical protein